MKMTSERKYALVIVLVLCVVAIVGCGGMNSAPAASTSSTFPVATQSASTSTEQPVPVVNPTQASGSDIPDTQVFVTYASSQGHYQLEVPEGWAQKTNGTDVSFDNNLNSLQVTLADATTRPTASSVRNDQAVTLQRTGRAIRDVRVQDMQLPNGPAVLITYTSNSDANPVTNKQVRLENNRYLFFQNGKLAILTLSAPVGADNVDQWARIARSFKWV